MDTQILKAFVISVLLGFIVGLERSVSFSLENEEGFAGTRTFVLISVLGFLSAWINTKIEYFLPVSFFILGMLVSIAYFLKVYHYSKQGSTTNIAALITFCIGILSYMQYLTQAILITVVTVVVLNLKTKLKKIENQLTLKEINAGILLLVMSFVLLPILPNKTIDPFGVFNPYKTWLMAIIIASLSFIGYMGIKFFGEKKGILFTAAAGGFISSTAVSASLGAMFKQTKSNINTYIAAIAIANTLMFARVLIEMYITNPSLAEKALIPYGAAFAYGVFIFIVFFKKTSSSLAGSGNIEKLQKNPLELNEAIKFALLFAFVYALVEYANRYYGNTAIYIVSFISGFTDVDAITLSLGELSGHSLAVNDALTGIVTASISNTAAKFFIVLFFSKKLAKKMLVFFIPEIVILSGTYLLLIL